MTDLKHVTIYTDGACLGNPGPGGYGVVLLYGPHRRELTGGYAHTTNNRMELMACIAGLEALKERCRVTLYTDSQYVAQAITEGWALRWRARGWKRSDKNAARNPDLWARLLDLCTQHDVTFTWVRGHAGNPENERCDYLSVQASLQPNLPPDTNYHPTPPRHSDLTTLFDP